LVRVLFQKQLIQIQNVFAGETVFIDYKSGLDPATYIKYSTPSGIPLIHKATNPISVPKFPGWGLYKFNPWREQFDKVHRTRRILLTISVH
jgi:hypothetical protein